MKGKRKCDSSIKKELSKDVSIRKNAPKERRNKEKYNHILKKQSFIISKKIMVDFGLICNGLNIEKNQ